MTPLPLRYVANIFCRRRSRAIFTVACLLVFGLLAASTMTAWNDVELEVDWEAEFERARRESLRDHMSFYVAGRAQLRPVPVEWTARDRCPACFGTDMCDPVDRQVLQSTISPDFLFSLSLSLSLLCVCSASSGRSRPPMTPVFSIMSSFLYMFIFHVVALHPVYHRISPTSSCPFHSAF